MDRTMTAQGSDTLAPEGGMALDMLKGAVAGVAATWVMDRVDWFMYDRESAESKRRTWEVRPEHKDPAHVIASQMARWVGAKAPPQDHPAGLAVHYAIGIAPAALYGAMRDRVPGAGAGRGLAYGFAVFVLEDEIANPAMGFASPPQRYPWQPHARGLVAHLVYGVVTDLVLRALSPPNVDRRSEGRRSKAQREAEPLHRSTPAEHPRP